jgi:hypothetical protein
MLAKVAKVESGTSDAAMGATGVALLVGAGVCFYKNAPVIKKAAISAINHAVPVIKSSIPFLKSAAAKLVAVAAANPVGVSVVVIGTICIGGMWYYFTVPKSVAKACPSVQSANYSTANNYNDRGSRRDTSRPVNRPVAEVQITREQKEAEQKEAEQKIAKQKIAKQKEAEKKITEFIQKTQTKIESKIDQIAEGLNNFHAIYSRFQMEDSIAVSEEERKNLRERMFAEMKLVYENSLSREQIEGLYSNNEEFKAKYEEVVTMLRNSGLSEEFAEKLIRAYERNMVSANSINQEVGEARRVLVHINTQPNFADRGRDDQNEQPERD